MNVGPVLFRGAEAKDSARSAQRQERRVGRKNLSQHRPPKKQKQAAATKARSKRTSKTKAAAGYRCWPAAALKAKSWLQRLRRCLRLRHWRRGRGTWRRGLSCAVAIAVAVLRRAIVVALIGGRTAGRIPV